MEAGRQRQFRIQHCLGRGGYGEVYRAVMISPGGLQSDVAVKLLRLDVDPGAEAVGRLRDEGRMLAALRHPAILRVYDLALLQGRVGLVTEFVEGQDLALLVGRIPVRALVEATAVVAEALQTAWSHPGPDRRPLRLIHRDIKPSNIRIGRHGEVKVLDFGIARSTEETDREARTGTGSTVGSLAYMAPERFTRAPAGPAADVYGLGCSLYEGLAGRRLFVDAVPVEMFRLAADPQAHTVHVEAALAELGDEVGTELRDLLRGMLAHAAAARPTAAEVAAACESLSERVPGDGLKRWARDRTWPDPPPIHGYLDGQTLTEGTLSEGSETHVLPLLPPQPSPSSETFQLDLQPDDVLPPAIPPRRWPWISAGGGVLVLAALGLGWAWFPGAPTRRPPAPPPGPVVVAPVPVPAPPAPVEPAPSAVLVPSPTPPPSLPSPRPKKPPAPVPAPVLIPELPPPAPVARGTLRLARTGGLEVKIELRGPEGRFGPGEVPVGRYELFADFGTGLQSMERYVDILPDRESQVNCNPLRYTCEEGD